MVSCKDVVNIEITALSAQTMEELGRISVELKIYHGYSLPRWKNYATANIVSDSHSICWTSWK